jgi:hypothetical protein
VVQVVDRPEVHLWQATNPEARDFRLDTIGKAYHSTPLEEASKGVYIGKVARPTKGFTAFFVELVYPPASKFPFKFTTEVSGGAGCAAVSFRGAKKYPLSGTGQDR